MLNPEARAYEAYRQKPKFGKQMSLKLMQALSITKKRRFKCLLFWTNKTNFHLAPAPLAFPLPFQPQSPKRHTPHFLLPKYKYKYKYTHPTILASTAIRISEPDVSFPETEECSSVQSNNPPQRIGLFSTSCTFRGKA